MSSYPGLKRNVSSQSAKRNQWNSEFERIFLWNPAAVRCSTDDRIRRIDPARIDAVVVADKVS